VQILGLGSSRIGLIIVYATTSIPFSVWMLKGYFDTIPKEPGGSRGHRRCFGGEDLLAVSCCRWPSRRSPSLALFSFMTSWKRVHPCRHLHGQGEHVHGPGSACASSWAGSRSSGATSAAGSIIVSIPVVLLFLYLQKYLVSGLTAGGVKG